MKGTCVLCKKSNVTFFPVKTNKHFLSWICEECYKKNQKKG